MLGQNRYDQAFFAVQAALAGAPICSFNGDAGSELLLEGFPEKVNTLPWLAQMRTNISQS